MRKKLLLFCSFVSTVLLFMPRTKSGVLGAAVICLLAAGWIGFTKKEFTVERQSIVSKLLVINLVCAEVGILFCQRWIPSSKVNAMASLLHVSNRLLVLEAGCVLVIGANYALMVIWNRIASKGRLLPAVVKAAICFVLCSVVTCFFPQWMLGVTTFKMGVENCFAGVLIVSICIWLLIGLTGSFRFSFTCSMLALPAYNQFLDELEEVIPAMNSRGYYSKTDHCFKYYDQMEGVEVQMLLQYEQLQYNSLFDKKNRNELLFPVVNSEIK